MTGKKKNNRATQESVNDTSEYNSLVPIGKVTVSTPGTTVPLSINCGPYGGQAGSDWRNPPVPGNAWRYCEIQSDPTSAGNLYVLPRGKTASANPEAIMAVIPIGGSIPFPTGLMSGAGILPENFVLDTDTGPSIAYGFGSLG